MFLNNAKIAKCREGKENLLTRFIFTATEAAYINRIKKYKIFQVKKISKSKAINRFWNNIFYTPTHTHTHDAFTCSQFNCIVKLETKRK